MGVSESKMSPEKPLAVVNPMPVIDLTDGDDANETQNQDEPKSNVSLQLFHYRQQMGLKQQSAIKWASSKLLLTEELLKQQKQPQQNVTLSLDDFDSDTEWAEQQLALLTDDDDDDNTENRAPLAAPLNSELNNLMNYRVKLRNTILHLAQEKLRKREKTKVKRLKRRTLISSKKPSNKDKYRD
ncbi:uncharacterized protein LOC117565171 [Drosophila albomicans]|uniref:Uncharacterized protein LOC117565171 n=1 Tax=Drosophila albomicans TaxID=7291 RepID=A0A9C6STJ2_DROAB|nr:uncharacterized protein LOC117565171 [Drosophila albomicans]